MNPQRGGAEMLRGKVSSFEGSASLAAVPRKSSPARTGGDARRNLVRTDSDELRTGKIRRKFGDFSLKSAARV